MKKNKMLEVKEKFLQLKTDLEKQVTTRNAKIQSGESKLKQRDMALTQRQEELQRKMSEVDIVKENLNNQLQVIEKRKQDMEKLHQQEIVHLETISGLSADDAYVLETGRITLSGDAKELSQSEDIRRAYLGG